MRYDDRNMVTERVSASVLQPYLIWILVQLLEHIMELQRQISFKTPSTPKMESSLVLVNGRRLQTSNILILDGYDLNNSLIWTFDKADYQGQNTY